MLLAAVQRLLRQDSEIAKRPQQIDAIQTDGLTYIEPIWVRNNGPHILLIALSSSGGHSLFLIPLPVPRAGDLKHQHGPLSFVRP